MKDLHIEWETGYINIQMDFFFPCGIQKFKKLLKVIELDRKHERELKEKLKIYFQNRIPDLVDLWRENSKKYYDNKQKAADANRLIESGKHSNGLPISKAELKQAKTDLKKYRAAYREAISDAKANKRFKEEFEKYLVLL